MNRKIEWMIHDFKDKNLNPNIILQKYEKDFELILNWAEDEFFKKTKRCYRFMFRLFII